MSTPSPLAAVSVFAVPLATLVAFAAWVFRDASLRGSDHPLAWALATATFGVVGVVYLGLRRRIGDRTAPDTTGERVALAAWVTGVLAFVVVSVAAPPDPFTQGRYASGLFVVSFPVVYAVAVWVRRD